MIIDAVVYGDTTLSEIMIAIIIVAIAATIAKLITLNMRRILKETLSKDHLATMSKLINLAIAILALIIIMPLLGINPTGLIVAGGIVALIIGFATQSIIGNIVSGLFLMIEKPFKIGQTVEIDGKTGVVGNIRMISTTIRMFDGLYVRVPNESVFTNRIINFDTNIVRRQQYTVGIRYVDDADKAIELIRSLLEKHPFVLVNPAYEVFVDLLADNSVNINILFWTPKSEMWNTKKELLWKIKTELEKAGMEFPSPQRELWFKNELITSQSTG